MHHSVKTHVPFVAADLLFRLMHIACWISKATHTHTHIFRKYNNYCYSIATIVTRMHLDVIVE